MEQHTYRIDNREKDEVVEQFCALAIDLERNGKQKFAITRENLIAGDVVVGDVCFERKEAADFVSSIIDHRLKDQCAKMRLNFKHIFIVLVGDIWDIKSNINARAIVGAQVSLCIRFGIHLIHVRDNQEFAWVVYSAVSKLEDGKTFNPEEHEIINYERKPEDRFVSMLSQMGIGIERSKSIAKMCKYDMRILCSKDIEDLTKVEGVGKKTAETVYNLLRGEYK
jgi:ERCC4-type nuclease